MTDRRTLQIRAPEEQSDELPAIRKKGRGWEISEKRLDALHERAREMRRFPSEAHKVLAERFAKADMGPYSFKRHAVVGSAIVDFACHRLGMAIAIDEEGENEVLAKRRDKSLEAVGIRVMRIKAADILDRIEEVLPRITAGMRLRIADKREARAAHRATVRVSTSNHASSRAPTRDPASSDELEEESGAPDQVRGDDMENTD